MVVICASLAEASHCKSLSCQLFADIPVTDQQSNYLVSTAEPVNVEDDARRAVPRNVVRYLVAPRSTPPAEILTKFLNGQGLNGSSAPLSIDESESAYRGKVVYAIFSVFADDDAYVLAPMTGMARSTVWQLWGATMKVVHDGGSDLGLSYEAGAPSAHIVVNNKSTPVMIRLDSPFSIYLDFQAFGERAYLTWQSDMSGARGWFGGAISVGMLFMFYLAISRRELGPWLYLLAQMFIAWWMMARMGAPAPVDSAVVQRMSLLLPLFGYLTIAPLALVSVVHANSGGRRISLFGTNGLKMVIAFNGSLATLSIVYALVGSDFGSLQFFVPLMMGSMVASPLAMLLYLLAAVRAKLPDAGRILVGQLLCYCGFGLILLRQYSSLIDPPVWSTVINAAVLSDLLFWNYISELLRYRSEKQHREKAAASHEATVKAKVQLDNSYAMLSVTNDAILNRMETSAHNIKNQISHIEAMLTLGNREGAINGLDDLRRGVRIANRSLHSSICLTVRPFGIAGEIIEWRLGVAEPLLAKRGISLKCAIGPRVADAVVDEYLMTEVLRELLTNACRYSEGGSTVSLDFALLGAKVIFHVENEATVCPERLERLGEEAVSPGATKNGEQSSGEGLRLMASLVRHAGGSFQVIGGNHLIRFVVVLPVKLELPVHNGESVPVCLA
ncbi:hypothetical protein CSQ89_13820 [Chitinimonas sp. BJB300]|nr:hypothetical protein CSQ89_13820 [Chitinimonas sp. BJB300]